MKTTAIIVAAGSGSRFNSETPKQFLEIMGKPIVVHAIERFDAAPSVDAIVLVLGKDHVAKFDLSHLKKVTAIVAGGASRPRSVLNCFDAVPSKTEIVSVAATLDRSQMRRALTPQVFKIEVLRKAFEDVELDNNVTDECYLVEKLGHPISIVEGSSRNIKITHEEDLLLAEALMKANE